MDIVLGGFTVALLIHDKNVSVRSAIESSGSGNYFHPSTEFHSGSKFRPTPEDVAAVKGGPEKCRLMPCFRLRNTPTSFRTLVKAAFVFAFLLIMYRKLHRQHDTVG